MLTESEAQRLLDLIKHFVESTPIAFPASGEYLDREVASDVGHESFLIDINRKGKIKITKCTFQQRYAVTDILLRLDIDGAPHQNPDGEDVPCPHLHVYKEGFSDKWAYPINPAEFSDTSNLVRSFREFLARCNVQNLPEIQGALI